MATASPSIGVIRAQIRAIRNKAPNAKVFGIFTPGRWSGPAVHGTGTEQIAVYQCDSPLQMRLALQSVPDTASATVLVTPLDQGRVSDDILVRMALRKLHPINSWEIVRSLFKARHLDPRITRHAFLAEMILEYAGSRDVQPVAGGLVDAETVWGILLAERLGLSGPRPDVVELLRATAEADLASRWRSCAKEFRNAARAWIAEAGGDASGTVLGCIEGEHGARALSIGLAMGVVYHDTVGRDLDKAAGRLEAYVGTTNDGRSDRSGPCDLPCAARSPPESTPKAHAASEETILCRLMDNRIRMLARGNARRLAMLERLGLMTQNEEDTHTPDDVAAEGEVQQMMATLTPLQQRICRELMNGLSEFQIAATLGRHYTTICRHVRHIRHAFADRGFDTWSA